MSNDWNSSSRKISKYYHYSNFILFIIQTDRKRVYILGRCNVESTAPEWCFRRIEVHPRFEPLLALKQRCDAVCSIFSNL